LVNGIKLLNEILVLAYDNGLLRFSQGYQV